MINSITELILDKYDYRAFCERCLDAVAEGKEVPHIVEYRPDGYFKVVLLSDIGIDENI